MPPELLAVKIVELPIQTAAGVNVTTAGLGFTVIITVDVTGPQAPGGSLVVSVSTTVPLVIDGV